MGHLTDECSTYRVITNDLDTFAIVLWITSATCTIEGFRTQRTTFNACNAQPTRCTAVAVAKDGNAGTQVDSTAWIRPWSLHAFTTTVHLPAYITMCQIISVGEVMVGISLWGGLPGLQTLLYWISSFQDIKKSVCTSSMPANLTELRISGTWEPVDMILLMCVVTNDSRVQKR